MSSDFVVVTQEMKSLRIRRFRTNISYTIEKSLLLLNRMPPSQKHLSFSTDKYMSFILTYNEIMRFSNLFHCYFEWCFLGILSRLCNSGVNTSHLKFLLVFLKIRTGDFFVVLHVLNMFFWLELNHLYFWSTFCRFLLVDVWFESREGYP